MKRSRKTSKFNSKLAIDVAIAALGVDLLPAFLQKVVPIDPSLYTVVGVGGTYLVGSMLKKPDVSNAAVGLGVVKLAEPFLLDMVGGISPGVTSAPIVGPGANVKQIPAAVQPVKTVDDYLHLNDYVSVPSIMPNSVYSSSY